MEDTILTKRRNYIHRLNEFNRAVNEKNRKPPRETIAEGIKQSTKITDEKTVELLTDKAVKGDSYVQNGNYDVFLFGIAESLEAIRCETSSQNEYFSWIDEAKVIMNNMTDGHVTQDNINKKEDFIKDSWQREAELLTCLALYEKSNNPLAKERHTQLMIKLQRLRQIRSALVNGTPNKVDQKQATEEERKRIIRHREILEKIRYYDYNNDYYNSDLIADMETLNISHLKDIEFYPGYSFYTRMLEDQRRADMLKNRTKEWSLLNSYATRPDEYLVMLRHQDDNRETVKERILRLSGRKTSQMQAVQNASKTYRERAFNAQTFMQLKRLREQEMEFSH